MKKLSLYVFTTALALGITASLLTGATSHGSESLAGQASRAVNAAFRDGLYMGKLDAAQGNRPHLSSGRWSRDLDRGSYVAGYQKGYNHGLEAGGVKVQGPQSAELVGYRDGISDGASDRKAGKPFQLKKNDNYRSALRGISEIEKDRQESRQAYRQAYANGYQEAYYAKDHAMPNPASELSSSL